MPKKINLSQQGCTVSFFIHSHRIRHTFNVLKLLFFPRPSKYIFSTPLTPTAYPQPFPRILSPKTSLVLPAPPPSFTPSAPSTPRNSANPGSARTKRIAPSPFHSPMRMPEYPAFGIGCHFEFPIHHRRFATGVLSATSGKHGTNLQMTAIVPTTSTGSSGTSYFGSAQRIRDFRKNTKEGTPRNFFETRRAISFF